MIKIDSLRVDNDETSHTFYVFIAKENNIFFVWTSEEDWEHQDFSIVRGSSNQYKSSQTAFDVFNFYADSFSEISESSTEGNDEG